MSYEKSLLSVQELNELFLYDPETGELRWRKRPILHFSSTRDANAWNTRFAGKLASSREARGLRVGINGTRYKCHRIIWKIMTGEEPPPVIDHRNTNPFDNRWENLRVADQSLNNANSIAKINETGYRGVRRYGQKYGARISKDGDSLFLGLFDTAEEAYRARTEKGLELYGEFYRE